MKSEDILDLLILIILITMLFSVGVTSLIRERDRTEAYSSTYVSDKNVKIATITQDVFGESAGMYTLDEVMLAFQIQSFYMQQPKKVSLSYVNSSGKTVMMEPMDVTTTFVADRGVYCSWVNSFITNYLLAGRDTPANREALRFTLELDTGDSLVDENDDFYVFREVQ